MKAAYKIFYHLVPFLFVLYFIWLIYPAITNGLHGTFEPTSVPRDYDELTDFLSSQSNFFRVMWVPQIQRFGYSSPIHPAVAANTFFQQYTISSLSANFENPQVQQLLQEQSIKYVIVPFDSQKEVFITDRKYDQMLHDRLVASLSANSWFTRNISIGKIKVYEIPHPQNHFFLLNSGGEVKNTIITDQSNYIVSVSQVKKGDSLIFSESFDKRWEMMVSLPGNKKTTTAAHLYHAQFNAYTLPQDGSYTVWISYTAQKTVDLGGWMSIGSISFLLLLVGVLVKKKLLGKDLNDKT